MRTEANIQNDCMVALSKIGCIVFRNNVGAFQDKTGRLIRYGVGGKGGSDLVGIAPDGRFLAVECKAATGRVRPEQVQFIDAVRRAGGLAGIARSADDAVRISRGEE